MATLEQKKAFALEQIKPYYKDPSLCGYDNETMACAYFTGDGKMCVVGKNLLKPQEVINATVKTLFHHYGVSEAALFKPESCGILTVDEWMWLQKIHDSIANRDKQSTTEKWVNKLAFFTMEELES